MALVTNANEGLVDIISLDNPTMPMKTGELDPMSDVSSSFADFVGDAVKTIEYAGNLIFAAVRAESGPGYIAIYSAVDLSYLGAVPIGAAPDSMFVSKDGNIIATASEGDGVTPGGIAIITLDPSICEPDCIGFLQNGGVGFISEASYYPVPENIGTVDELRAAGVRIVSTEDPINVQLIPEAVSVTPDGKIALLNYQVNNAVSAVDVATGEYLWTDSYGTEKMTMDPSDRDGKIAIASEWFGATINGLHMPDALDMYEVDGKTFVVTANEGAGDDVTLGDVGTTCENNDLIVDDAVLGRLAVIDSYPVLFDDAGRIICDTITTPSTRSFSIYEVKSTGLELVYDSGSSMEEIIAETNPEFFNSQDDSNEFDSRSDAKGLEPEGIKLGVMPDGTVLCFISSERVSGVFVYDVSDPYNVVFQDYMNRRNFGDIDIETQVDTGVYTYASLDVGPEDFTFISAENSPTCQAAILVASPISGTTTYFNVVNGDEREGDGSCATEADCNSLYGTPPPLAFAAREC